MGLPHGTPCPILPEAWETPSPEPDCTHITAGERNMRYEPHRAETLRVAYYHRVVLHAQTYRRLPADRFCRAGHPAAEARRPSRGSCHSRRPRPGLGPCPDPEPGTPPHTPAVEPGTGDERHRQPAEPFRAANEQTSCRTEGRVLEDMHRDEPHGVVDPNGTALDAMRGLQPAAVKPLALATELMNVAQDVMFEQCPEIMIRYGGNRLWENGAYVGSIGDVTSRAVQNTIRRWRRARSPVPDLLVEVRRP